MNAILDFLNSTEMTATFGLVLVMWAIVGGPMRFMKPRYKLFVFLIAGSLMASSIEKVSIAGNDSGVTALAKTMVVVFRYASIGIGVYVLFRWDTQCNEIKDTLRRRHRGHALPRG